jgi:DNA-binding transcriptional LysR family regulator
MTLIQMKYFVVSARLLKFTAAARELYVSQQVISQCVSNLEKELGLKLFDRTTKNVNLTLAGESLFRNWGKLLEDYDRSVEAAMRLHKKTMDKLCVGIPDLSKALKIIKPRLNYFIADYQGIELTFEVCSLSNMSDMLVQREANAVITLSQEIAGLGKKYESRPIMDIEDYLVFSARHPFGDRERVTLSDLNGQTIYVLSDRFSHIARDRTLGRMKAYGAVPSEILFFDTVHSLELALYKGKGIAITPQLFFEDIENDLCFHPISNDLFFKTHMVIAWRRDNVSSNLSLLVDYIVNT